jgi:rubrerythrin
MGLELPEGRLRRFAAAGLVGAALYHNPRFPQQALGAVQGAVNKAIEPAHSEVQNPNEVPPDEQGMSAWDYADKLASNQEEVARLAGPYTRAFMRPRGTKANESVRPMWLNNLVGKIRPLSSQQMAEFADRVMGALKPADFYLAGRQYPRWKTEWKDLSLLNGQLLVKACERQPELSEFLNRLSKHDLGAAFDVIAARFAREVNVDERLQEEADQLLEAPEDADWKDAIDWPTRKNALFDREKQCHHPMGFTYTGKMPNTGKKVCPICGTREGELESDL